MHVRILFNQCYLLLVAIGTALAHSHNLNPVVACLVSRATTTRFTGHSCLGKILSLVQGA